MKNNQKGSALFLVIVVLSVVLTIVLGLGAITTIQFKTSRQVGDSVVAFYAADAGAEIVLRSALKSGNLLSSYVDVPIGVGGAVYSVSVFCGNTMTECPTGFSIDPLCTAQRYCITSTGEYKNSKRTVEVKI